jgi:lipoate-protein ligase A
VEATAPALILGRAQKLGPRELAQAQRLRLEVVRRPSGGGALVVEPGQQVWVDLFLATGSEGWDPDVRRQACWAGEMWGAAVEMAGCGPAVVWRGPMSGGRWSKAACFAGTGPGEVLVGGRKVTGISQRRTSHGVLIQTACLLRWDPSTLGEILGAPASELEPSAAGLGAEHAAALAEGFVASVTSWSP